MASTTTSILACFALAGVACSDDGGAQETSESAGSGGDSAGSAIRGAGGSSETAGVGGLSSTGSGGDVVGAGGMGGGAGEMPTGDSGLATQPDVGPAMDAAIRVTDNVMDEGLSTIKIETPTATYFYDKKGGGFSSIVDRDGNDWVGFHPSGGFNGDFRGIPNLGPCCHAGNPDQHPGPAMESRLMEQKPERVVINSTTADGKFDVTWVFRASSATLTVTKIGGQKYWFLYEGTPGGALEEADYWVSAAGVRHPVMMQVNSDLPSPEWVYFGDGKLKRVLFLAHHEDDAIEDQHYAGAVGSMTVFGFGRTAATTLLSGVPQHFSIGIVESTLHDTIRGVVEAAIGP